MNIRRERRASPLPSRRSLLVAAAARAEIIEQILVKVNGEIFTKTDLENAAGRGAAAEGAADRPEERPDDAAAPARRSTRSRRS